MALRLVGTEAARSATPPRSITSTPPKSNMAVSTSTQIILGPTSMSKMNPFVSVYQPPDKILPTSINRPIKPPKVAPVRPIGTPCYCLLCWEQVLWLPDKEVFDTFNKKIKSRFGIDCTAWDIREEPFPICKDCTRNFQRFFKDYERLKAIQAQMEWRVREMRGKVRKSLGKCLSEEERIKSFRERILSLRDQPTFVYLPIPIHVNLEYGTTLTTDEQEEEAAVSSIINPKNKRSAAATATEEEEAVSTILSLSGSCEESSPVKTTTPQIPVQIPVAPKIVEAETANYEIITICEDDDNYNDHDYLEHPPPIIPPTPTRKRAAARPATKRGGKKQNNQNEKGLETGPAGEEISVPKIIKVVSMSPKKKSSVSPTRKRGSPARAPASSAATTLKPNKESTELDAAISSIVETTEPENFDGDDGHHDDPDYSPDSSAPVPKPKQIRASRKRPEIVTDSLDPDAPPKPLIKKRAILPKDRIIKPRLKNSGLADCVRTTDGRMLFEGHEVLKTLEGFACKTCGLERKGKGKGEYNLHQIKWHIMGVHLKYYQCENCKSYLGTPRVLKDHVAKCTSEAKLDECDICGRPVKLLEAHKFSHKNTEERAEAKRLGLIPKGLYYAVNGTRQNKQKLCPCCNKTVSDATYRTHMRFVGLTEEEKRKMMLQCEICKNGKLYANRSKLLFHQKYAHVIKAKEPLFACAECSREFYIKRKLWEHIQVVHKNNSRRGKMMTKDKDEEEDDEVIIIRPEPKRPSSGNSPPRKVQKRWRRPVTRTPSPPVVARKSKAKSAVSPPKRGKGGKGMRYSPERRSRR